MTEHPPFHALIVAAGRGERAGLDLPKQFADLGGRAVLRWSAEAFVAHPACVGLTVVVAPDAEAGGLAAAALEGLVVTLVDGVDALVFLPQDIPGALGIAPIGSVFARGDGDEVRVQAEFVVQQLGLFREIDRSAVLRVVQIDGRMVVEGSVHAIGGGSRHALPAPFRNRFPTAFDPVMFRDSSLFPSSIVAPPGKAESHHFCIHQPPCAVTPRRHSSRTLAEPLAEFRGSPVTLAPSLSRAIPLNARP